MFFLLLQICTTLKSSQIGILNKIVNREQIKQTKHYIVVGFVVLVVFLSVRYYGCVHGMDMNELTINILGIICI